MRFWPKIQNGAIWCKKKGVEILATWMIELHLRIIYVRIGHNTLLWTWIYNSSQKMVMRVVFLEGLGSVKNDEGCFSRRIRFRNWVNLDALSRISSPLPEQFQVYQFVILWQILFSYYFFHFIIALRNRFVRWERNRFVFVCVSLYIRNIFSIEAIYPSLVSWEIICTTVRKRGHTQNMLQSTINDK